MGTLLAPLGFALQRPSKEAIWDSAKAAGLGRLGMQRSGTSSYKPWLACMLQENLQHPALQNRGLMRFSVCSMQPQAEAFRLTCTPWAVQAMLLPAPRWLRRAAVVLWTPVRPKPLPLFALCKVPSRSVPTLAKQNSKVCWVQRISLVRAWCLPRVGRGVPSGQHGQGTRGASHAPSPIRLQYGPP